MWDNFVIALNNLKVSLINVRNLRNFTRIRCLNLGVFLRKITYNTQYYRYGRIK